MNQKEAQWRGYYKPYTSRAARRGIHPLALLDQEWADGQKRASQSVFPHVNHESVVLEIACGIGRVSRFVAPKCKHLCCADILEDALQSLNNHLLKQGHTNISIHKINGYDLNIFPAECFDCVYSFTAFFHLDFEIVVHYFSEIKRVLKPNGIAILEFKQWVKDRDVFRLLEKIEKTGGIQNYESTLDKWRYVSKEMLKVLCDYHGFTILDDDVTNFTFRK
jgi:ubiquinone/menaquinone biosynthesis C-methylase UbiE